MTFGFLLLAMNLVIAARHASASRLGMTLICTALVVKHVNRQHQRFKSFLMNLISNGPKKSNPVLAKGKTLYSNLSLGRSAMKGWNPPTCCFLHLTHFNFTFHERVSESKYPVSLLQKAVNILRLFVIVTFVSIVNQFSHY